MASIEGRTDLPNFETGVLSLWMRGSQSTVRMVGPRWETIGGRLYLVGTWAENLERVDALAGCDNAVAWDQVDEFLIFKSIDEYERRLFPDVKKPDRVVSLEALRS
ncbi:MAG TPA: hypothetical protein VM240_13540 [Verrucomicrobiae bacterium]|nr:hypothetical protein [Verrucomicrobiae bacterium]